MLWGTESLVVKDMFETKTFFLKSVVKGSCTLVEFRVSLEKKRTDGKVFIYEKLGGGLGVDNQRKAL